MKKKSKDSPDPVLDLLDKLLGPVEELSGDELSAEIANAGIDLASARRRLYERVSQMRSALWEKNIEVPSQMVSLLNQFRPHDLPSSDPIVAKQAAASYLRDLVGRSVSQVQFAVAARNLDGTLSEYDEMVRRDFEEELKREQGSEDAD